MNWLIIGGGVSGLGAAAFLVKKLGATVRVSEGKTLASPKAAAFRALGVELCDGGHRPEHLDGINKIVLSPGLPQTHELVVAAKARGLPLVSEIDLALEHYRGTVIGVTGTNGKSTTCAMLGHVLARAGVKVSVGGNFGDPPTAMLADDRAGDVLVLELSSYQLEQSQRLAPKTAVFTSFSHDHTARHGSLENYMAAKWRLFEQMTPEDTLVIPSYILALAKKQGLSTKARIVLALDAKPSAPQSGLGFFIDKGVLHQSDCVEINLKSFGIPEAHNQLNAAFTLHLAAPIAKRSVQDLAPLLQGFRGLPHRCEVVGTIAGKTVIDDSKSTNVESTLIALQSQDHPVLLFMGGQGKDEPYAPLLAARSKIAALVTFGASGGAIAEALRAEIPTQTFSTLKVALKAWETLPIDQAQSILFSPGCASFDEFQNYSHRGDVFRTALVELGMKPSPTDTADAT